MNYLHDDDGGTYDPEYELSDDGSSQLMCSRVGNTCGGKTTCSIIIIITAGVAVTGTIPSAVICNTIIIAITAKTNNYGHPFPQNPVRP